MITKCIIAVDVDVDVDVDVAVAVATFFMNVRILFILFIQHGIPNAFVFVPIPLPPARQYNVSHEVYCTHAPTVKIQHGGRLGWKRSWLLER